MTKTLLSAIALAALSVTSAIAADLPIRKAPPPPPPPVYTWTGCYVGVGVGYKMWNIEHHRIDTPVGVLLENEGTSGGRGWLATGQFGCDYQLSGTWVIGAFTDYDWTNAKGDYFSTALGLDLVGERKERSQWAAGARLGYLVTPALLSFVSGGWTEARFGATNFFSATAPFQALPIQLPAQTRGGWFFGGGAEYHLGFFPGLTWKTEYRLAQYDNKQTSYFCTTASLTCGLAGVLPQSDRSKLWQQSVRTELVWRFGGSPVRAAY